MTLLTAVPQTRLGCPTHPATSSGVLATEQQWVRALENGDPEALSCILAPEFVDTDWRGEVVRRDAALARGHARARSTLKLGGVSVLHLGRFAIVRGTNTQVGPDGAASASVRFTDVFVYRGGSWRAISAQETLIAKE
jgi:hypothetical protein